MFDNQSQSSANTSKFNKTSFSYNAVSQMSKNYINQIKVDAENLMNVSQKCDMIWHDMRKLDIFTGCVISKKFFEEIFLKYKEQFYDWLRIQSLDEFFQTYDENDDQSLSEDEQVMIFSSIKEKMAQVSKELLKIHEYSLFKDLMKELRKLEKQISQFQNILRQTHHKEEINIYHQIGDERLDDFNLQYFDEFNKLEQYKNDRINTLHLQQLEEMEKLEEKLGKTTEMLKIKPKKKLKEYQTLEQLVSIEERVEEAQNYRKELNNLEVSEAQRVENLIQSRAEHQRNILDKKHKDEMKQLNAKLEAVEVKLIIKLQKDYDILQKKIYMHENEIKRLQAMSSNYNLNKGDKKGELNRFKRNIKIQNEIINSSKKIQSALVQVQQNMGQDNNKSLSQTQSSRQLRKSQTKTQRGLDIDEENRNSTPYKLKQMINKGNIQTFNIRQEQSSDIPINFRSIEHDITGENKLKIQRYLSQKKKERHQILPSLTNLYDSNLSLIKNPVIVDKFNPAETLKRKDFVNSILFSDKK